jgi:outer membrane protein assembly factor BamB
MNIEASVDVTSTVYSEAERLKQKLEAQREAQKRKKAKEAEAEQEEDDEDIADETIAAKPDVDWLQWGGPRRDFKVSVSGLAKEWPKNGPKKLWSRELGDGYSSIVSDGKTLYTMYWIPGADTPDAAAAQKDAPSTSGAKQEAAPKKDAERGPAVDQNPGEDKSDKGDGAADDEKEGDTKEKDAAEEARRQGSEVVVALDAKTGRTIWEYKYPVSWKGDMSLEFGPGPNSTPLIVGDRLYTLGSMVRLHCLDRKTGKKIWQRDLAEEHEGSTVKYGYGVSPVAYQDTIITSIGGEGHGVIALNQADGTVVWEKQDFGAAYGSPLIINVDGEEQLLVVRAKGLAGLDPASGELKWSLDYPGDANISSPIWGKDNIIFISSAYGDGGARGVKLTRQGGKTTAEELWFNPKMKIHHGNAVRVGDVVYGSSGDFGSAFLEAVNVKTGELLWKQRGFSKATCIYADGKLIVLDEDGNLALGTLKKKRLKVHSRVELCKRNSWTAPTLLDTRLFVRDRRQIMALDLGQEANGS